MKTIEYKTATGTDITELDKEVNKLIKEGFEPYGPQHFHCWDIPGKMDTHGFFQPMVRKDG